MLREKGIGEGRLSSNMGRITKLKMKSVEDEIAEEVSSGEEDHL